MKILSITTISSMNDQYGYRSLCTSPLIHCQSHNTYSDGTLKCSSFIVADLVSSVVLQSCMSVHDCMVLMVRFIPGISSSLLSQGCVWTANSLGTAVVSVCMVLLFCTSGCIVIFLCSPCEKLATSFQ